MSACLAKEKCHEVVTIPYVTETIIPITDLYKHDEEEGFFDVALQEKKTQPAFFCVTSALWKRAGNSTILGYVFISMLCCCVGAFVLLFFGSLYLKDMIVANIDVDVLLRQVTIDAPKHLFLK